MLDAVARNGSSAQRAAVLSTLANDQTFRALRASLVGAGQPSHAVRRRGAVSPHLRPPRTIYSARNDETLPGSIVGRSKTSHPAIQPSMRPLMGWAAR